MVIRSESCLCFCIVSLVFESSFSTNTVPYFFSSSSSSSPVSLSINSSPSSTHRTHSTPPSSQEQQPSRWVQSLMLNLWSIPVRDEWSNWRSVLAPSPIHSQHWSSLDPNSMWLYVSAINASEQMAEDAVNGIISGVRGSFCGESGHVLGWGLWIQSVFFDLLTPKRLSGPWSGTPELDNFICWSGKMKFVRSIVRIATLAMFFGILRDSVRNEQRIRE